MLDLKRIRENKQQVADALAKRMKTYDLDAVIAADDKRRALLGETEALKAQAVISRTIVYSSLKGKHANLGFDACATTNCQVYNGYDAEQPSTNDAVDATSGIIVKYNGKAAETLFGASNGGYVEASENVWSAAVPYLTSFKDEYEKPETIKGLVWSVSVTADEIAEAVKKCGADVGYSKGQKNRSCFFGH